MNLNSNGAAVYDTTTPHKELKQVKDTYNSLLQAITEEVNATSNYPKITSKSLFLVQPANSWIEQANLRPEPNELYRKLWYEGELSMLYADSNVGKTILAVQIGNDIAKSGKPVIYFDFELSDKQFEARYSENYTNHYQFPSNFYRAEIDPDCDYDGHESFDDYLISSLESVLSETGYKILIIDNITYLKNETDKAKNALPLMKHLKALKKKYDLSILVLAHTPKRDLSKPITQNDLAGSKMLINFCDSAFAMGSSHTDGNIRYVKQIKQRNCEQVYGADNVIVFQVSKPSNYLFMEFMGFSHEREHLKVLTEQEREGLKDKAKELSKAGRSQREIAAALGIAVGTVNKYVHS